MSVTFVSTSTAIFPKRFAISFAIRSRRRAELTSISSRAPFSRNVPSVVLSQSLCWRLPALIQVNSAAVIAPALS
jgi:hypothetical protein